MRSFLHLKNVSLATLLFFLFPVFAYANTLGMSPNVGVYTTGKTFPVSVYVTSTSDSVNAISSTITFPVDKLQVVSVSKSSSVLSLWVTEPTYSNNSGTISFEGVVPNPGFQGTAGRVVTINFKVVGQGEAPVKFGTSQLLANDGNGTNILKYLNSATFTLQGSQTTEILPTPTVVAPSVGVSKPPIISSNEYPVQGTWYASKAGTFSWKLPQDITSVRMLVGKEPTSEGTVVYTPPVSTKTISNTDDGIWYLHVQFKNSSGWSQPGHYMFRVDTTPPENFSVKGIASTDPTEPRPSFALSATDVTSGVNQYSVQIDSLPPVIWQDDGTGVYRAPVLGPGIHTLVAKAFDFAGNFSTASTNFSITGIGSPVITSYTETISGSSPLVVHGTSSIDTHVRLIMSKTGSDEVTTTVDADSTGAFVGTIDGSKLVSGVYKLTAVAVDNRGAESLPSTPKTIFVNAGWFESLGATLSKFLSLTIPILALIFFLVFLALFGYNKVRIMKRRVGRELHDVERMVDKAFALLKEDIEDSIHLLEKTKNRRRLTEEEAVIVERFRQNLLDAEKVIHKQMRDIEKEIGE